MIYFFINVMMYLIIIMCLCLYYKDRINIINFIIILFNMNVFFIYIYQNINFIYGIITVLISLIIYYFINLFNKKEEEIILIQDGNINFHELIKHYHYNKLIRYLKFHHFHLDEIEYCILKNNKLITIRNKSANYPISIIVDGKLLTNNLKLINKGEIWLKEELNKRKILLKNIEFAYYKNKHIYFINN